MLGLQSKWTGVREGKIVKYWIKQKCHLRKWGLTKINLSGISSVYNLIPKNLKWLNRSLQKWHVKNDLKTSRLPFYMCMHFSGVENAWTYDENRWTHPHLLVFYSWQNWLLVLKESFSVGHHKKNIWEIAFLANHIRCLRHLKKL